MSSEIQDQFIKEYAPYICKWGLVQPEEGTISDNGIRFTGEALIAARLLVGEGNEPSLAMKVWINERLNAIENCQRLPGVFQRYPGCNTQEGFDDYFSATCVGYLFKRPFALNAYLHGLDNFGVFKSTPSSTLLTWRNNPLLWRNPGMWVHMKNCAGEKLSCVDVGVLKNAINRSAKSKEQDHKILAWFIIEALQGRYKELDDARENWWEKLREHYGSIGGVLGEYFYPRGYSHPNSKYLMSKTA